MRRIKTLSESPCYKCSRSKDCEKRVQLAESYRDIKWSVFGNADFSYKKCGIFIALNAERKKK